MALHQWMFGTKTFQNLELGAADPARAEPGRGGPDDDFAARSFANVGAWIMGRNMFGPQRDAWTDEAWRGWWGENPPYHVPVFVLTHHARAKITMEGGTSFHFVTEGTQAALERARAAADGKDVRVGGGAATIRQYLTAGLIDELHLVVSPVVLGRGEPLLTGIDTVRLGYQCTEQVASSRALHVVLTR
jgi:dihydrofolate reductase